MEILQKLEILAGAAKYDVSCSSSGGCRTTQRGGFGNSCPAGVCHSFTEDGRCISLLKILLTNVCVYDCAYCANRKSNDTPRATFKVEEVANLTVEFYKRNYIEGLFLSSGVIKNPDYTMEALIRVAKSLREEHKFGGYIHLKAIPGANPDLIALAGYYADRMSVNIEIPSEPSLKMLAPDKNFESVYLPMNRLRMKILEHKGNLRKRGLKKFVPAGQSTQMIVGASPENDLHIITLAAGLYKTQELKRVYYSGYIPVNTDNRLPAISQPPLKRENRLYQADWLMRFYGFSHDEILDKNNPWLDPEFDPKMAWALRHPDYFPIDLDSASYEEILRVPGIGVRSAKFIVHSRRFGSIRLEHLKKMGVALKRAKYFLVNPDIPREWQKLYPEQITAKLITAPKKTALPSLF
ncbi:MAG: putative DNA modification/repair radical SAM protein [Candidatus Fibromonas sp.]|jgi:putative DNA modification/repair radical SAM protein|nr:putative DNA modification/repair radical SAM protein [Candidatus Fibromonas sp.]